MLACSGGGSGIIGGVFVVAGISRSRDRAVKMSLPWVWLAVLGRAQPGRERGRWPGAGLVRRD